MSKLDDREREQQHFQECIHIIQKNISTYEEKEKALKQETDELYAAVQAGDVELYNQLITSLDIMEHTKNALRKNRAALDKPYFGRIDYEEVKNRSKESLYIGKNGVTRKQTDVIIVDWRAPVSSVYYENALGEGSYQVPGQEEIPVFLTLKRTYDAEHGKLLGFYDSDVASNDELLVKYLAKNKDVVLGDIIATIQKEQNQIIRDNPFKHIIVQGVAGSGKTTVAMHRISYILYNYADRFAPEEFCIVGSNDMLLGYITSGLPELDVGNVGNMRMDAFFIQLLGKEWKKRYRLEETKAEEAYKSRLEFILALEEDIRRVKEENLKPQEVRDEELGVLLSEESIADSIRSNPGYSLTQLAALLNERLKGRIRFLTDDEQRELRQRKNKEYKHYFDPLKNKKTGLDFYLDFLQRRNGYTDDGMDSLRKGKMNVYDAAALLLIHKRLTAKKQFDDFRQIIVDEAQDFGEMIYYVMKQVMPDCYFTIMGDVSQNINYETGMNSWDGLKHQVFAGEKDSFYVLAKSYRNTIEISGYAGRVLEKASASKYKIQPVIRHGREVAVYQETEDTMMERLARVTKDIEKRGYDTIAVICRTKKEAKEVEEGLKLFTKVQDKEGSEFKKGIMVLPIEMTKGLEFDAVILWKPDSRHYGENEKEAKLLYVAITRALHELHLIGVEEMSTLLNA